MNIGKIAAVLPNINRNKQIGLCGLRMSCPLHADIVSFRGSKAVLYEQIKEALDKDDNVKALEIMRYNFKQDENGGITINEDVNFLKKLGISNSYTLLEKGIDAEKLMKNVIKINGDLYTIGTNLKKLNENLEVSGFVHTKGIPELFKNFSSQEDFAEQYGQGKLTSSIIKTYTDEGILKPSLKTKHTSYFNGISEANKDFFDKFNKDIDNIYNNKELKDKFGLEKKDIQSGINTGKLNVWGIDGISRIENSEKYLYYGAEKDINSFIKSLIGSIKCKNDRIIEACERNRIEPEGINREEKTVSIESLEKAGYGSKADIIANADFKEYDYYVKRYILENDEYYFDNPSFLSAAGSAKENNPAVIELGLLSADMPDNVKDIIHSALIFNKLNVISDLTSAVRGFSINLNDKKNLEFLRTIDNADFQKWIDERLAAYEEYKAENQRKLKEFINLGILNDEEVKADFKKRVNTASAQRKIELEEKQAKKLRLEQEKMHLKKEKMMQNRRNQSLRSSLAWALSPNTRAEMKKNFNPYIREILTQNTEAAKIHKELFMHEITFKEAETSLSKVNISEKEKIALLSYFKKCWDAVSSEEYKKACEITKPFYDAYLEKGLDGIDNEAVRKIIEHWEIKHKALD